MDDCPSSPSKSFIKQSHKPGEHMGSSGWSAVPGSSGPMSQPQLEVCRPRTSYFKRCFPTSSKKGHPFSGYSSRKAALIRWHKTSAADPSFSSHSLSRETQTHPPLHQHWEAAEQPAEPTGLAGSTSLLWTFTDNHVACDKPAMPKDTTAS